MSPLGNNGGATTSYLFSISAQSKTEFSTSIKSLKIILPSDYNMGNGITLNCVQTEGFNSNPTCSTIAKNIIAVNFDTSKIGDKEVFVFTITDMINPLVENGPFIFSFDFVKKIIYFLDECCEWRRL